MLNLGQNISSYQLLAQIASGGQATVYRARHTVLQREVALKVLHAHLIPDASFVQKFAQEAQLLAQLKHPNIVEVYNAGYDAATGVYFIEMEFLPGSDLDALISQQGRLAVDAVINIAKQVASTLEYAHARGLIHRDIKPSNIVLLPDGRVKVLDFGIAAIVAAGQKARTRIGTPEYMAPEHYGGNADARSDIYSLGATLYHCLTGQVPPIVASQPPTPVRQLNPGVSPALENVILKSLQADAAKRQQTAREFILAIEDALRAPQVSVSQPVTAVCLRCGAENRLGAKHCAGCGETSGLRNRQFPALNPGILLSGRYQINDRVPPHAHFIWWGIESFRAKDIQTGAQCYVIPMGIDPAEDQWLQQLAGLRHQVLPKMEIVTHQGASCFVSNVVVGTALESITVNTPAQLTSLGLQLCDFLESTGFWSTRFSWLDLFANHILLDWQGRVLIDAYQFCYEHLSWHRLKTLGSVADKEREVPQILCLGSFLEDTFLTQEKIEEEEIVLIGSAMAQTIGISWMDMVTRGTQVLALREGMPLIPATLEQAILGALTQPAWMKPLAKLKQHLSGQSQGPAQGTISSQYVDFGNVPWGETPQSSITIASQGSGLIYGKVACQVQGMWASPTSFLEIHPCQVKVEIRWDTTQLEKCGSMGGEILIATGANDLHITARANIQPNAAFYLARAKQHLERGDKDLAFDLCDQLIRSKQSKFEGYRVRANVYDNLGEYEKSMNDYSKALQIRPTETAVLIGRGNAYMQLKKFDPAIADYSQAIVLNPQEPSFYWNRSLAFEAQGKNSEALNDLRQYVSLGGRNIAEANSRATNLRKL